MPCSGSGCAAEELYVLSALHAQALQLREALISFGRPLAMGDPVFRHPVLLWWGSGGHAG